MPRMLQKFIKCAEFLLKYISTYICTYNVALHLQLTFFLLNFALYKCTRSSLPPGSVRHNRFGPMVLDISTRMAVIYLRPLTNNRLISVPTNRLSS